MPTHLQNADPLSPRRERHKGIGRLARLMAGLCTLMIVGVILYLALVAFLAGATPMADVRSLPPAIEAALGLLWLASQAFLIWGLWSGRRCFIALSAGELFASHTIKGLRNFTAGLFLYKAFTPVMLLTAVAASKTQGFSLPAGTVISGQDLGETAFTLVSLGAILVIAGVLTYAAEIAEDQMSIV